VVKKMATTAEQVKTCFVNLFINNLKTQLCLAVKKENAIKSLLTSGKSV
jgi:hypothetical protein